jgi:glycosyltransferase 2 family protein
MASPVANQKSVRIPGWLGTAVVYAISVGCLWWVYHGFDWKSELPRLKHIHWAWIVLAVACDVLVYISQAWRWNLLLAPVASVPLWRSVKAVYIGLFANEVLPFRSGEIIRCYLQAHWSQIPLTTTLSSALIERLVDGVWLIAGFQMLSWLVPSVPDMLDAAAGTLTVLVGFIGGIVVFAVLNNRFAHHMVTRHRWSEVLRTIIEGLHTMGRSRSFFLSAAASTVYLALQVIPIYAMIRGYGVDQLTMSDAAVVLVVLRLSTVVPGLPGNLGLFNAAAYLALHRMLGVDAQTAKSLSAVMFFIITVPLLVAGWIALAATGLELREVYRRAHERSPKPAIG